MAVWHVELHLVPRRGLATAPSRLTPGELASTDWWADTAFTKDYPDRLAALGPATASAARGLESWGQPDGNRVDVRSAGGRVSRVTALADVRLLDARFGAALLTLARAADALLVRSDGLVVETTIAAYASALRTSVAWREAGGAPQGLDTVPGGDDAAE